MANKILNGSFSLTAVVNGTNYTGRIVVHSGALAQFITTSGTVTPDWSKEVNRPVLYMEIVDQFGKIYNPSNVQLYYNGSLIEEDNTSNFPYAKFETKTLDEKTRETITFTNNVAYINSGTDSNIADDTLYLTGDITVNGNNVTIRTAPTTLQIVQTASGDAFIVMINGSDIIKGNTQTTLKANIYDAGGNVLSDLSAWTLKWFELQGSGEVYKDTGQQLVVRATDIEGFGLYKCTAEKTKDSISAEPGYCQVRDLTDPYIIALKQTGVIGDRIYTDQTATYTAVLVDSNGIETDKYKFKDNTIEWNLINPEGNRVNTSGEEIEDTVDVIGESISLTYQAVQNAGGSINGYINAEIELGS